MSAFNNEIHVNQQNVRWIDRLSPGQYGVLVGAAVIVPSVTTIGVIRTYKVWRQYLDAQARVKAARMFLKSAAAFNPKFYPALLPRIKVGEELPHYGKGRRLLFPNLDNYRELGHGVTQYNWRNNNIESVQKALKRIDSMTTKDLWTFATLYSLASNTKEGRELIEKQFYWVLKGEVTLDDLRDLDVPEVAKWDLPEHQRLQYESEGWSTITMENERAEAFARRYEEAEKEFMKKGGKAGEFRFNVADEWTAPAKAQQKDH